MTSNEDCPIFLKFLVTNKIAGLIIGKQGSRISQIQNETGATVKVSSVMHGVPTDRVVVVAGYVPSLQEALDMVLSDMSESGGVSDLSVRVLVPPAAAPGIIGRGGSNIREISVTHGAVVRIASRQPIAGSRRLSFSEEDERMVTVTGEISECAKAIMALVPHLREFSRADCEETLRETLTRTRNTPTSNTTEFPPSLLRHSCTIEMHVSNDDVGAVIGKAGQRIAELTQRLSVFLRVSRRGDLVEGSHDIRRVTLTGAVANVHRAHLEILQWLQDAANAHNNNNNNHHNSNSHNHNNHHNNNNNNNNGNQNNQSNTAVNNNANNATNAANNSNGPSNAAHHVNHSNSRGNIAAAAANAAAAYMRNPAMLNNLAGAGGYHQNAGMYMQHPQ